MSISQTITPLPAGPSAANDDDNAFQAKAEARVAAEVTMVTEINSAIAQINATEAAMNSVASGGGVTLPYTFSTTTTDSDPGPGVLRLGSSTQNTASAIRMDLFGSDGSDFTSTLDLFDDSTSTIKGFVTIQKANDGTKWLRFSVTSMASPSGYRNIIGTCVASSATNPFANGDPLVVKFTPAGDKGTKGDTGTPGSGVLLATLTPTAAANVDFLSTFTSAYDAYMIVVEGVLPAASDALRMRVANAGVVDSASNYALTNAGGGATGMSASVQWVLTGTVLSTGAGLSGVLILSNCNDATRLKHFQAVLGWQDAATPTYATQNDLGVYAKAASVSGFRLYWGSGSNFQAVGKVLVYGFSNT